jgi:elongation factor Ts
VKFERAGPSSVLAAYIHTGAKIGVLVEASERRPAGRRTTRCCGHRDAHRRRVAALRQSRRGLGEGLERRAGDRDGIRPSRPAKPPQVVEKIVAGRIEKYYGEACLLEQPFVKDREKTVQAVSATDDRARFARFVLGEGA